MSSRALAALLVLQAAVGVAFLPARASAQAVAPAEKRPQLSPEQQELMRKYDQRREGALKLGDSAPDVTLIGLDGQTPVCLRDHLRGKPLVVIFGSYT